MPAKKKGGGENIRVCIRTRGLNSKEMENGDKNAVNLHPPAQIVVSHPVGDPDSFTFDAVYGTSTSQKTIFLTEVQPLLDSVLQGFNATVFAYGQSGSGKTYTMTGNLNKEELKGMMPQAVSFLFEEIKKLTTNTHQFKVKVSYIELYNGKSRDLLATKQVNLEIKENMAKNFYVKGAETPEIDTYEKCMDYFNAGTERRQTASTGLNDVSSRSHALFSLIVDQIDTEQDPSQPVIMTSKMNIVDLAGSEKLSKTGATGETAAEGNNINLSLSALATVIDTIVKGGKHIPYRGNALTMLLKDSLGGNAKTVMFATCGPSDKNVAETISTLRFAMRAKQITNKPVKNMDPKDSRIAELLEKIEELQRKLGGDYNPEEDENLQRRIEELELENASLKGGQDKNGLELEETNRQLQAELARASAELKEKVDALTSAAQDKVVAEANLTSEIAYTQEFKTVTTNFIKRVLPGDQLIAIRNKMPPGGDYNKTDDGWELREIQFYLEGFVEAYEAWRATITTNEDVQRHVDAGVQRAKEGFQRQLDESMAGYQGLQSQLEAAIQQRAALDEELIQLRADKNNFTDEKSRLEDKIRRDQEKMKAKLDKLATEQKAQTELLDNAKAELSATEAKFTASQAEVQRLKDLLSAVSQQAGGRPAPGIAAAISGATGGSASGGAADGNWNEERQKLQQQISEITSARNKLVVAMRRKGFCLQDNASLIPGDHAPPPPPGSEGEAQLVLADADEDVVDGDVLGMLQQQMRIQHRLHELRHQHQKKLADMIKKYERLKTGQVTPLTSGEGSISEEALAAKVSEALAAKEAEYAKTTQEYESNTQKLVKKLNKQKAELKELESNLAEEKATIEELKAESDQNREAAMALTVEVEKARKEKESADRNVDSEKKAKEATVNQYKQNIEKLVDQIEEYKKKLEASASLRDENRKLQDNLSRAEAQCRQQIEQVDKNRQHLKQASLTLEEKNQQIRALLDEIEAKNREVSQIPYLIAREKEAAVAEATTNHNLHLQAQHADFQERLAEEHAKQEAIREKLRKAKSTAGKAAQRYDEMVLENEALLMHMEETKVQAMKLLREKQEAERELDSYTSKPSRGRGL